MESIDVRACFRVSFRGCNTGSAQLDSTVKWTWVLAEVLFKFNSWRGRTKFAHMVKVSSEKKDVYTVISGTNRAGSHTEKVAKLYIDLLKSKGINATLFSLKKMNPLQRNDEVKKIEREILNPTTKFIFVIPEYNGSYPGVLKTLIDNSDIRKAWHFKKALLTGVATGRAGNLRGMDHLADTLQYLKMTVHYNKLPISRIDQLLDEEGKLDDETLRAIDLQLDEFIDL